MTLILQMVWDVEKIERGGGGGNMCLLDVRVQLFNGRYKK